MLEADLHRKLRDFPIDLDIRAEPGKILALMGENGAGKSTALNIIAGLLDAERGTIKLNGRVLYSYEEGICVPVESRNIGYVLQHSAVFPHLSVTENIAYGMKARHVERNRIAKEIDQWMGKMDIRALAGVKAGNLSGGQKQRVALARALATGPDLLMLDEPFTGLDAESMESVRDLIRSYTRTMRIPCILVTHCDTSTLGILDDVCRISRGAVVESKPLYPKREERA